MKNNNDNVLFLLDPPNATIAPTRATDLNKRTHSPRVREPNHGAEVDIWGAAYCLMELTAQVPDSQRGCGETCGWGVTEKCHPNCRCGTGSDPGTESWYSIPKTVLYSCLVLYSPPFV